MPASRRSGIIGIALTLFIWGSCAPPSLPGPEDVNNGLSELLLRPEVTCEQLRVAFNINHLEPVENPAEAGLDYTELWTETPTGQLLRVWYIPAERDRGTIVLSQGSTGNMACYLYVVQLLHDFGWSAVMYDYEGFGGSTGVASLSTIETDLDTVVDWALENTSHGKVTLVGVSLGCIPAVAVAVERPADVNGVVLDSPVALGLEVYRARQQLGAIADLVLDSLDRSLMTETRISRLTQPLLMFLHEDDTVTPPDATEILFDLAPEPKTLVRFPALQHAQGLFFSTETFLVSIEAFLSDVWEPADELESLTPDAEAQATE